MIGYEEDKSTRHRTIAVQLAMRGFDGPRALDCMEVEDAQINLKDVPPVTWKPLLRTAIDRATLEGKATRKRNMKMLATLQKMMLASPVKLPKKAGELQQLWDNLDGSFASVGMTDITLKKPSVVIEQCAAAVRKGLPVVGLLSRWAVLALLENRRGSLGSTLIGERSWIACLRNNGLMLCHQGVPTTDLHRACHDVAAVLQMPGYSAKLCRPPRILLADFHAPHRMVLRTVGALSPWVAKTEISHRCNPADMQGAAQLETVETIGGLLR